MSIQKVEMTVEQKENGQYVEQVAYPYVEYDHVTMENGMDIMSMIRDDVSTPLVTHNTTSWKVGQGDGDVSESIVDSSVGDMTIKGQTYQNILPNPSLRNTMTDGKTMQKLNEGYESVNTVDGVYKSAILKGCTSYRDIDTGEILETFEEGRNLELVSVRMPVLTTCGKNLFDGETERGFIDFDTGNNSNAWNDLRSVGYTEVIGGNKINIYVTNSGWTSPRIFEYDKAKNFIKSTGEYSVVLDNATKFVRFNIGGNTDVDGKSQVMLYYGEANSSTTYEPYKTNILTVNEDVELQGIGEVQDTLDLMTGEIVSNFATYTFNGSEFFFDNKTSDSHVCFGFNVNNIPTLDTSKSIGLSKDIPYQNWSGQYPDKELIYVKWAMVYVSVSKDKLVSHDVNGLKMFLKEKYETGNPISFIYPLHEKPIKTVDLSILNQDNQPVEQLQSYANGYIQLSSNVAEGEYSLTPTIDYEVPTSNSYYLDLAKPSTQYTMKNMQGTFTLDGTQYNASTNGTFTTLSTLTNKFMVTSVVQSQPMLLEGDMTSKEVPYVEGNKSAFEGADKVEIVSQNADNSLSNTTSFQLSNPLRSLPNGVRDEIVLDRVNHKTKIIQRVGEDLTQLDTPFVTEVNLEGYPYVYKGGHIFLNTEIAPITEVTYSINQAHQIESSNEDILRHQKEINHLYELIAQYVQVQYEAELIDIALQG